MKKNLKSLAVASLLLMGTSAFARIDNMSINAGVVNTTAGDADSTTGISIGGEWSFQGNAKAKALKGYDIYLDLGYNTTDDGYVTKFAIAGRYMVYDSIWIGASAGVSGYSIDNDYYSTTYSGFMYGLNTKYSLTENHAILLEYRSATVYPSGSSYGDIDVSSVALSYSYSF
jgi:hypothetical protein